VRQKQALVDDVRDVKYLDVLPNYDAVSYLEGKAQFNADGTLMVGDAQIAATNTIIATGSRPHVPDIDGLSGVAWLDSTSALELEDLPAPLMVMGGGYIGVELAQMFARAGSKVAIVTRRGLLPEAEPEFSAALTRNFAQEGITVLSDLSYEGLREADGLVTLSATHQGQSIEISAQKPLLAGGRIPNTEGLALEAAGIATDATGAVLVDAMMRRTREGVYAVGDVTGPDQFPYMAA
jgi:mercuric reductase